MSRMLLVVLAVLLVAPAPASAQKDQMKIDEALRGKVIRKSAPTLTPTPPPKGQAAPAPTTATGSHSATHIKAAPLPAPAKK